MPDAEPRHETPTTILDELRAHPEWPAARRDAALDRLVARFPTDELIAAVLGRLHDLGGADAEAMLRLIEAQPRPDLLGALADAVDAQPGLPPERAWDALAVLDGAGVLGDHPTLAERWDDLNEVLDEPGTIEELAAQIEDDPEGVWMAIQGLAAVEAEVRPEIVSAPARVPLGPRLVEFLRLLAYSHDEPTRSAALDALGDDPAGTPALRDAWHDLASHHHDPAVVSAARVRLGHDAAGLLPPVAAPRAAPRLVRSLISSVDGRGRATIILSGTRGGDRATAAFLCDVERGVVGVAGEVEPESAAADATFDELAAAVTHEAVDGADEAARGLLAGSLWLSGPGTPPSWRFWVEATVGPIRPAPVRAGMTDPDADLLSPAETAERCRLVLDACPDWLDDSALTFELAEEILLREGESPPDPKRDAGAYRYLFEHRLQGQLEVYRRMLLWMASFWEVTGARPRAAAALGLAAQISDAQNVVPGHPFTVALSTRSLAAAQDGLRKAPRPGRTGRG